MRVICDRIVCSVVRRSASFSPVSSDCTSDEIDASGLFTSCATPAAKVPAAASRSALSSVVEHLVPLGNVVQDHLDEALVAVGDQRGIHVEE